jgi:hypothetical protein|tara:strand:+ start:1693 stop:2355 length:663 start_codon:yes stop_codon:yes gene_type:complete
MVKKKKQHKYKSSFFDRKVSAETSKALNKEIENVNLTKEEVDLEKVVGRKDDRNKARLNLANRLNANDFTDLTFLADNGAEELYIFDKRTGFEHHFGIYFSYLLDEPISMYSQLLGTGDIVRKAREEELEKKYRHKSPRWKFDKNGFQIDASTGIFLDFPELSVDFIPCQLTPGEVVICRDACVKVGDGDARRGGQILNMLNAIWTREGRKLIKEGERLT